MSTTNKIMSIFKSRATIIELLKEQGYGVADYLDFNINEIDAMIATGQLDMLVSLKSADADSAVSPAEDSKKLYVKYYLGSKQLHASVLDDIIEDLFVLESVLTKKDTLVVIIENEPNESALAKVEYLYEKDGIFVVLFNIRRLQFNILKHKLVPPIYILDETEKEAFMRKYNINSIAKIPEIGRFDPQAQAVFLRPGQICRFERDSISSLKYDYYRVCV